MIVALLLLELFSRVAGRTGQQHPVTAGAVVVGLEVHSPATAARAAGSPSNLPVNGHRLGGQSGRLARREPLSRKTADQVLRGRDRRFLCNGWYRRCTPWVRIGTCPNLESPRAGRGPRAGLFTLPGRVRRAARQSGGASANRTPAARRLGQAQTACASRPAFRPEHGRRWIGARPVSCEHACTAGVGIASRGNRR
jgi:hypothetical protein